MRPVGGREGIAGTANRSRWQQMGIRKGESADGCYVRPRGGTQVSLKADGHDRCGGLVIPNGQHLIVRSAVPQQAARRAAVQ